MIIVDSVGKNQILAKNKSGQWFRVNDKSVKVGDIVPAKNCTKLPKSLCRLYNSVDELLKILESNPIFNSETNRSL